MKKIKEIIVIVIVMLLCPVAVYAQQIHSQSDGSKFGTLRGNTGILLYGYASYFHTPV